MNHRAHSSIITLSLIMTCCGLAQSCGPSPEKTVSIDFEAPALDSTGDCDGLAGAEEHLAGNPALEWSAIHAGIRFFGTHQNPFEVDAQLVSALGAQNALVAEVTGEAAAFREYANAAPERCFVSSWSSSGNVIDSVNENVQWLIPGQAIELKEETTHVLIDLRSAPSGPILDAFIEELLRTVIAEDVVLTPQLRAFNGMRDEVYAPVFLGSENVFQSRVDERPLRFEASAEREPTLAFLVGERIAPEAARLAIGLRVQARALMIGSDIRTVVAEHVVHSAAEGALYFRGLKLQDENRNAIPDLVVADIPLESAGVEEVESLLLSASLGELRPVEGPSERPAMRALPAETNITATARHEGSRQAALIITHGASDLFFPYWDAVDADPDSRLDAALALERETAETEADFGLRSIEYFSHTFHDSHGFTYFAGDPPSPRQEARLPVVLDANANHEPIIRLSNQEEFNPGDVIEGVDGVSAADLIAYEIEQVASSEPSAIRNGLEALYPISGTHEYALRNPAGERRSVVISLEDIREFSPAFPNRAHGSLDEYGAPNVLYIDLQAQAVEGPIDDLLATMDAASAVVFDMRGYPGPNSWELIENTLIDGSPGAKIRDVHRTLFETWRNEIPQPWPPHVGGFAGPVAIITAPTTQSQAEHLVLTLQGAGRVTVVGRPSAGANGTLTSIGLPGNYAQSFTGLEILQPDESVFHGVGVVVDERVDPEQADLADGVDSELQRAIDIVSR